MQPFVKILLITYFILLLITHAEHCMNVIYVTCMQYTEYTHDDLMHLMYHNAIKNMLTLHVFSPRMYLLWLLNLHLISNAYLPSITVKISSCWTTELSSNFILHGCVTCA